MDAPRVVIVSDDPLTRSGLAALLGGQEGLTVEGSGSLAELHELVQGGADVALLDLAASHEAVALSEPALAVPMVVLIADEIQARDALEAGAHGSSSGTPRPTTSRRRSSPSTGGSSRSIRRSRAGSGRR